MIEQALPREDLLTPHLAVGLNGKVFPERVIV